MQSAARDCSSIAHLGHINIENLYSHRTALNGSGDLCLLQLRRQAASHRIYSIPPARPRLHLRGVFFRGVSSVAANTVVVAPISTSEGTGAPPHHQRGSPRKPSSCTEDLRGLTLPRLPLLVAKRPPQNQHHRLGAAVAATHRRL